MNRSDIRKSPDYIFHLVENSEYRENLEQIHKSEVKFSVKNLVHDTSLSNFVSIIYQQKMIGGKREIKDTGKFALSWWGVSVDINSEQCQDYLRKMKEIFLKADTLKSAEENCKLLKTSPFIDKSRYGNFRLSLDFETLFDCYEKSIDDGNLDSTGRKAEIRLLGTHLYRKEVMYTLLIHPKSMNDKFEKFQRFEMYMATDPNPITEKRGDQWIWYP